jgi:hypothetical protein
MAAHVSPVRRALGRSVSAIRKMYDEQVYAFERLFRAGLPRR